MAENSKIKEAKSRKPYDVLAIMECDGVSCDFDVAIDDFDLALFFEATGLSRADTQWSTVFYARSEKTGYHVHFAGRIKGKRIRITLEYFGRSVTQPKEDGPFAENAMEWLGSFFKKHRESAYVHARFSLPISGWGSRFNLPFTVSMGDSGKEVGIYGITMRLPKNPARAEHGSLNLMGTRLLAGVSMNLEIPFKGYQVRDAVLSYKEALKIFVYEKGKKDV